MSGRSWPDGCHVSEHGERVGRAEASDVTGLADQLGDGSLTRPRREVRAGAAADTLGKLCPELARLGQESLEPGQPPASQLRL